MATARPSLRPISSVCSQCRYSLRRTHPTNHQRPFHTSPSTPISRSTALSIDRPLQKAQQQPLPPRLTSPPPGYRMNKLTRPFVPVATHQRVPFKVNESKELLDEMYDRLLGEGGSKALTDEVKWQCITHKSFDHGLQPYNTKLVFYGRRIAYLHSTLSIVHRPPPPPPSTADIPPPSTTIPQSRISNDTSLPLNVIEKWNPVNKVNAISVAGLLNSTNIFGIAQACGLVRCLRWKPRNPTNLTDSGVQRVAEDAVMAVLGAIALQRGGEAARLVMEERILPGARVVNQTLEQRS
ncbi:hypothetical protein AA313_de0201993 [Arthrobotrys entomopaga]|nr:hypothetical protein AA313_de0201993 [Arthrobotrys entomopaga]